MIFLVRFAIFFLIKIRISKIYSMYTRIMRSRRKKRKEKKRKETKKKETEKKRMT
jgi:hypothetical protein